MGKKSDLDLKKASRKLKKKVKEGIFLDEILIEAFALVRETAKRVAGMTPYDVQVMAAIALLFSLL